MKKLMLILLVCILSFVSYAGDKKKGYVSITKISKLKKYNKHAVWRKVRCKHCNGTGSRTVQKYNAKKNTMKKYLAPCHYCKGRGTRGMSRL